METQSKKLENSRHDNIADDNDDDDELKIMRKGKNNQYYGVLYV